MKNPNASKKITKKPTKNKTQIRELRQRQRHTLTFIRMCRYGVNNFSRNIWLTVAATAVMSVTLLIIFTTLVARNILMETVKDISQKVDISIYIATKTDEIKIGDLKNRIEKLENVKSVRYISAEEARKDQIERNKGNIETLNAIKEANNKTPAILRINLVDINNTTSLEKFINEDDLYKEIHDTSKTASFQGERRTVIETIGSWAQLASMAGAVATTVFFLISSLVVFNTIRMAIFNRKDEIQMMKLIGADRGFIRGPFLVEASMYGFFAAILATVAGYSMLLLARQPLIEYGILADSTINFMFDYVALVTIFMILGGALIGIISSYIATRKYLHI